VECMCAYEFTVIRALLLVRLFRACLPHSSRAVSLTFYPTNPRGPFQIHFSNPFLYLNRDKLSFSGCEARGGGKCAAELIDPQVRRNKKPRGAYFCG
jgi:hypothetical protein